MTYDTLVGDKMLAHDHARSSPKTEKEVKFTQRDIMRISGKR